jgi:hypothetical protein
MQLALFTIPMLYFIYLLDPFTDKVRNRNYKRLINNDTYLKINLFYSLLTVVVCLTIAYFKRTYLDSCIFCLAPFLFIILVKFFNRYSIKKYNRDFYLILRGDTFKYEASDLIISLLTLISPNVLSFILIAIVSLRFT